MPTSDAQNINLQSGVNMGVGYVDLMMNSMLMEQMKVVSGSGGFTVGTIFALLMILSINEIKPLVGEYMKYFATKIPEKFKEFMNYIFIGLWGWMKKKYEEYKKSKSKQIVKKSNPENQKLVIEEEKTDGFSYSIKWTPKIQSAIIFLSYILKHGTFEKEKACNINSESCQIQYKNIGFKYNNVDFKFSDTIITFMENLIHKYETPIIENTEFDFGTKDDPTCLTTLMEKNKYSEICKNYVKAGHMWLLQNGYYEKDIKFYYVPFHTGIKVSKEYYDIDSSYTPSSGSFGFEFGIAHHFKSIYKNLNLNIVLFEILLIRNCIVSSRFGGSSFYQKIRDSHCFEIESLGLDIKFKENKIEKYDLKEGDLGRCPNYPMERDNMPEPLMYIQEQKEILSSQNQNTISVIMKSGESIDYNTVFINLLKEIWDDYEESREKNKKEKVNVYELKIKREYKESVKDNPRYLNWIEQVNKIKEMFEDGKDKESKEDKDEDDKKDDKKDSPPPSQQQQSGKKKKNKGGGNNNFGGNNYNNSHMMDDYGGGHHGFPHMHNYHYQRSPEEIMIDKLGQQPQKSIVHKEEIITIEQKPVNTVFKGFETLYLRKNDKTYLHSILSKFSSCADIYTELDIPHKLGVLLHGEPGTGKSSTIKTIASFIKRDIYYVDLSDVKKNCELKMIFDHVNKGSVKGGVMVFEDIDCMTDVVKPRKSRSEYEVLGDDTLTSVVKHTDGALSLSYFLNLLDGTLAADNMLFVMTTNHIENLDPALIRNGRVDVNIELRCCDRYQIASIYEKITKKPLEEEVLNDIEEFKYKPIDVITHVLKYYICNMETDNIMEPFCKKV
jgi:ATPase family associated with various cellular activities (AAA)